MERRRPPGPPGPRCESTLPLSSACVWSGDPPEACQHLLGLGPRCLPPRARRAACLPHRARPKVSRCVFGLKDDVFTERLHRQLQMTFQELNYSVSVFAEFRNR